MSGHQFSDLQNGVIVPPFIVLLEESKSNACEIEKCYANASCGLLGVAPLQLWGNR